MLLSCQGARALPEVHLVNAHLRILDWPREDRPREKLERCGPSGMTDSELLAIILGVGEPRRGNALVLARSILSTFGGLRGLKQACLGELMRENGIGTAKGSRVIAAFELGRRCSLSRLELGVRLGSGEAVFEHYSLKLGQEPQEVFFALALDARNRLLREVLVARGTLTSCPVHPREVFRPMIREAAASCLLVHNHPSGDPEPSTDDLSLTRRLARGGSMLGIKLLDHIIIGRGCFVSLAERGVV